MGHVAAELIHQRRCDRSGPRWATLIVPGFGEKRRRNKNRIEAGRGRNETCLFWTKNTSELEFLLITISLSFAAVLSRHSLLLAWLGLFTRYANNIKNLGLVVLLRVYRASFLHHFNIKLYCIKCFGNAHLGLSTSNLVSWLRWFLCIRHVCWVPLWREKWDMMCQLFFPCLSPPIPLFLF